MTQSMDICPQIAGSKGAAASPPPASRMLLYMNVPGQLRFIVNGRLSSDSWVEGGGSIPAPGITRVTVYERAWSAQVYGECHSQWTFVLR